jgi:hypothetical protein
MWGSPEGLYGLGQHQAGVWNYRGESVDTSQDNSNISIWLNFWTGESQSGGKFVLAPTPLETLPLFVRSGSIVPMGPAMAYTGQYPEDPIELRIYAGADADFTLYEDDGLTYDYEKGAYAMIPNRWDEARHTLTIGARQGSFPGMLERRAFNIVWVGPGHGVGVSPSGTIDKTVAYDGTGVTVQRQEYMGMAETHEEGPRSRKSSRHCGTPPSLCRRIELAALSLGERVAHDGVFSSRHGSGEGSVARPSRTAGMLRFAQHDSTVGSGDPAPAGSPAQAFHFPPTVRPQRPWGADIHDNVAPPARQ